MYVLQAWPTIHACMYAAGLNASLHVYYGFTQYDEQRAASDNQYRAWMSDMRAALGRASALGVHYMGMRSHSELARAMAQSGFYLYPTIYPETSCIALMQAYCCIFELVCCSVLSALSFTIHDKYKLQ